MPSHEEIASALAMTLRQLRRKRGLTRPELARLSGVPLDDLIALERGRLPAADARELEKAVRRARPR